MSRRLETGNSAESRRSPERRGVSGAGRKRGESREEPGRTQELGGSWESREEQGETGRRMV